MKTDYLYNVYIQTHIYFNLYPINECIHIYLSVKNQIPLKKVTIYWKNTEIELMAGVKVKGWA